MKDESCFSIWLRSVLILDTFFQREGFYLSTKMILKMTIVHSPYLRSLQSLGLYLDSYDEIIQDLLLNTIFLLTTHQLLL